MAQDSLGLAYYLGEFVGKDYGRRPNADAQFSLGVLYRNGQGVPQDYVQAYMWYDLAMATFPPGQDHDKEVNGRERVAAEMTPAQIDEAQRLARAWKPKPETQ